MKKSKISAIEIAQLYNRWIEESRLVRSSHTVDSYEITVNQFIHYVETECKMNMKSFDAMKCYSKSMIEDWLRWLQEKGYCTPQSCNVRLSNLRSFLKYLSSEDYKYAELYLSSMAVERRNAENTKIYGVSKRGIEALLDSIDTSTDIGIRDYVLWELVYKTAMRIGEALSIRLKHLNLYAEKPFVTVVGKRSKVRTAYLQPKLAENLRNYVIHIFGKNNDGESFLFFSRVNGKDQPMTTKGAELRLKKYAKIANEVCKDVPIDLHPHQLRHARATHLLEKLNIIQLSKFLGHEDVSTTMRYLDLTEEQTALAMISLENEKEKSVKKKWPGKDSLSALYKREKKK